MLSWLSSRFEYTRKAAELYGAVVAAARRKEFFADCGIYDTPEGRYEVLVIHLVLLVDRLAATGGQGERVARLIMEAFVRDMDDNMREMGVGDLSVPRKVQRAAAGFYERAAVYKSALAAGDMAALATLLAAQMPGLEGQAPAASKGLARYVLATARSLRDVPWESFVAGGWAFPHGLDDHFDEVSGGAG